MKQLLAAVTFTFILVSSGCAHSPPYDPAFNADYEGKPQGPIFYSDGRLTFYGDAAKAVFDDIQAQSLTLENGNVVKPANDPSSPIQCFKLRDKRNEKAWFYTCAMGLPDLTGHKKQ